MQPKVLVKQKTNGPVNAHLISGSSISTEHTTPCYAPNFEKVGGAYCFWSLRASVRASHLFVPTVIFKTLKIVSLNFTYGFLIKKLTRIFFLFRVNSHFGVMAL